MAIRQGEGTKKRLRERPRRSLPVIIVEPACGPANNQSSAKTESLGNVPICSGNLKCIVAHGDFNPEPEEHASRLAAANCQTIHAIDKVNYATPSSYASRKHDFGPINAVGVAYSMPSLSHRRSLTSLWSSRHLQLQHFLLTWVRAYGALSMPAWESPVASPAALPRSSVVLLTVDKP